METVVLKPLYHREQDCIGIYFAPNAAIHLSIQKDAGARWSHTNKCWCILLTEKNYQQLAKILSGEVVLQANEMKEYLFQRKKNAITKNIIPENPLQNLRDQKTQVPVIKDPLALSKENENVFIEYRNRLLLKGYS